MDRYKIRYYINSKNGSKPAQEFIINLPDNIREKVYKYLDLLCESKGYLDEPYSRHIVGKIRELRVDFSKIRHRIFYFTFVDKQIILLYGFIKKTEKTPTKEIEKAQAFYNDVISNPALYETK